MEAAFQRLEIFDEVLDLNFPAMLFYPTEEAAQKEQFGPYEMMIKKGGSLAGEGLPLVVISHGSGGSGMVFRGLAIHLAKAGFMVAVPEHPFNNRLDNSWEGKVKNLIHRPRHLSLLMDVLYQKEGLGERMKKEAVAVIGHSIGGYTALAIAGGIANTGHLIEFCKQPENQYLPLCRPILAGNPVGEQLESQKDERVKAIVLMAGASIDFKSAGALDAVDAKVLMYTPSLDETALPHSKIVELGLKEGQLSHVLVENAGHYSFLSPFPESIRSRVGPAGMDAPGFDRATFLEKMNGEIEGFLRGNLG